MVTASRDDFLRFARTHKARDPMRPIRVMREIGWAPTLFSHEDAKKPTVVNAAPVVYLTYVSWHGEEPVLYREMFGGVIAVLASTGVVEVVLEGSLHDWLIANANEVMEGEAGGEYVRVYKDEPDRELAFAIDRPTSLVQKM